MTHTHKVVKRSIYSVSAADPGEIIFLGSEGECYNYLREYNAAALAAIPGASYDEVSRITRSVVEVKHAWPTDRITAHFDE